MFNTWLVSSVLVVSSLPAMGQWFKVPETGIPRLPNGQVDLAGPVPKLADGKPDLSGIWSPPGPPLQDIASGMTGPVPYTAWSKPIFEERADGARGKEDPAAYCVPTMPKLIVLPYPYKILQGPGMILVLYEGFTTFRQIFTDGRALPKDPQPSWIGYSVGHWEGDTLVVDTIGVNEKTWLDNAGRPHTADMKLRETYRRKDFGHLEVRLTIDDPKAYSKPLVITEDARLLPETELLEYTCTENNKDVEHLFGK